MNGTTKKIISALSACIILMFLAAALNRTGSLILFWKEEPLSRITHDEKYGYYAYVPNENVSRLGLPVYLKEDESFPDQGMLSVNEDITATIKTQGGGRYTMQDNNDIFFSASDNDPEKHEYNIVSPVIIQTRYLLALACLAGLVCAADLLLCRKYKDYEILWNILLCITAVLLLMMLIPWNKMIFSGAPTPVRGLYFKPILQRNPVFYVLLFILLAVTFRRADKHKFFRLLAVLVVVWNTVCYFLPEWDMVGQRADTHAYLQQYTASSIRTPGYPVFIEAVFKLSGNDSLPQLRSDERHFRDETLQNGKMTDSLGLLNVVRAQKCVLFVSFLTLFFIFSRYYSPLWLTFTSQLILCCGFLGVDNSYVMTECLSQAILLLITAFFILNVKEKSGLFFLIVCILSAIAILIRPANIFLVILLFVSAVITIRKKHSILIPVIGCLVFLAMAAIPAVTIYRQYKIFVWMPTSGYVEIARAVDLMEPGDEDAFVDPELRDFCHELLVLKEEYPDADQNTNMWQVGIAAAEKQGYDLISCSPVLGKVSRKIFMLHFSEFVSALTGTMKTALERTRLQIGPVPFIAFLLLFTLLFVLRISSDSLTGMLLVLLHCSHLCLCMMNQPERRYIYSTEILCLLGWLLILVNLFNGKKKERE